jgi:hypothetical protein
MGRCIAGQLLQILQIPILSVDVIVRALAVPALLDD